MSNALELDPIETTKLSDIGLCTGCGRRRVVDELAPCKGSIKCDAFLCYTCREDGSRCDNCRRAACCDHLSIKDGRRWCDFCVEDMGVECRCRREGDQEDASECPVHGR